MNKYKTYQKREYADAIRYTGKNKKVVMSYLRSVGAKKVKTYDGYIVFNRQGITDLYEVNIGDWVYVDDDGWLDAVSDTEFNELWIVEK